MRRLGGFERLEPRRALAVNVVTPLPDVTATLGAAPTTISLQGRYDDPSVTGTVVRFDTNLAPSAGPIFTELFDQAGPGRTRTTPLTVANFLSYADAGSFGNTIIHRSVPGFVVQGGGFAVTSSGSPLLTTVPQSSPVLNEPGNTNIRGTIAMAKVGGDPNSATNQWFFSLANNSANLDSQNGGFTAFGRVLGNGMTVVDAIAALPVYNAGGTFSELPLQGTVDPAAVSRANFVSFPAITRVGELVYSVTSSAPAVVTPSILADGSLRLVHTATAAGTATVTLRASSVYDATSFVEDSFVVTVKPPSPRPADAIVGLAGDSLSIGRMSAGALVTTPLAALPAGGGWTNVLAGDFNGDRRTDTAARSAAGQWWVTMTPASGAATPPTSWGSFPSAVTWQFFTAGDFNGDGRSDIAALNASSGAWRVLTSTGSGFTTSRFGDWPAGGGWTNVLAGDFDGDGRSDLVGQRVSDGAFWVSRSTGSAFVTTQWHKLASNVAWESGVVGDFDGDGRSDVAVRNAVTGAVRVLTSTGSAFTSSRFGDWALGSAWVNVRAGDFDGDGRSDLVGQRVVDGTFWVSRSTGTAFVTTQWHKLASNVAWEWGVVGDLDGDGRSDLSVRNAATGAWRLLSSTGSTFTSARIGDWSIAVTWTQAVGVRASASQPV